MSESASISIDSDESPQKAPVRDGSASYGSAKRGDPEVVIPDSDAASSSMKESISDSDVSVSDSGNNESDSEEKEVKSRDFDVSRISANEDELVVMKSREKSENTYKGDDADGLVFSDTEDEPTVKNVRTRQRTIAQACQVAADDTKRSKACLLL